MYVYMYVCMYVCMCFLHMCLCGKLVYVYLQTICIYVSILMYVWQVSLFLPEEKNDFSRLARVYCPSCAMKMGAEADAAIHREGGGAYTTTNPL